jgi:hypothetical protein
MADKAESQVGLLCGQRTRPNGFAVDPNAEIVDQNNVSKIIQGGDN